MEPAVSSSLYHWFNLFSAESELITVPATAIIHSSTPGPSLIGTGPGLIHTDLFAQEVLPVKALYGRLSLRLRGHLHKTKTPGLAIVLVFDHSRRSYLAEGFKSLPNRYIGCLIG